MSLGDCCGYEKRFKTIHLNVLIIGSAEAIVHEMATEVKFWSELDHFSLRRGLKNVLVNWLVIVIWHKKYFSL